MKNNYSVLLAFRLAYSSNRNYLSGIARHLRRTAGWRTHVYDNFYDFTDEMIDKLCQRHYDGIITVAPHDPSVSGKLARLKTPLVLIAHDYDMPARRKNITIVQCDNATIGNIAARHFMSLGKFRTFAFVMSNPVVHWAEMRLCGFREALSQHGYTVASIISSHQAGSERDLAFLRQQIAPLPKPLAIFAAYDQRAAQVLQACTATGFNVPKDIQIIGVDDDPVFCDLCRPTLTSISTGQRRMGEVAALELDRMMTAGGIARRLVTLRNAEIIERESTAPISPATTLVDRALSYIYRHATDGIGPRDVVTYLGVSHALVGRRIKQLEGRSLAQIILLARLKAVRSKLRTSKMSISAITRQCGFDNADYAKRAFRKTYGQTMREYRNRHNLLSSCESHRKSQCAD